MAFGDLDCDGDLDIAEGTVGQENKLWMGSLSGTWGEFLFNSVPQNMGTNSTQTVALGDVDKDGDLDIVEANYIYYSSGQGQPNRVWLNKEGKAFFHDSNQELGSYWSTDIALGDLDADGDLDIVEAVENGPNWIYLNNKGTFTKSASIDNKNNFKTMNVVLGDLDRDGDLDIVEANYGGPSCVWFNDGTGNFATNHSFGNFYPITRSILGDLDGDGDLDLMASSDQLFSRVWINEGNGKYKDSTGSYLDVKPAYALDLGDVDNDGDLDCLFACSNISGLQGVKNELWINNGKGKFKRSFKSKFKKDLTWSVKFGDLDGDGDLDIVEANYPDVNLEGGMNRIWLNGGTGKFYASGQELGNYWTLSVGLGDVDQDGDLDIVSGNTGQSNLVWLCD
jgi:hypothetical protein